MSWIVGARLGRWREADHHNAPLALEAVTSVRRPCNGILFDADAVLLAVETGCHHVNHDRVAQPTRVAVAALAGHFAWLTATRAIIAQ
jgi:hypothetical protein